MSEAKLEQKLKKSVDALGGLSYKFLSNESGVPDRIVIHRGEVFFVEMKTDKGRLTPRQILVHQLMNKSGVECTVIHNEAELQAFLDMLYGLEDK